MAKDRRGAATHQGYARVSPLKPDLRGASRIMQSRVHASLRAATLNRRSMAKSAVSLLGVFAALAFLALWLGGYLPAVKQGIGDFKQDRLMAMGFVVERIDVMGEGRLNEADVRAAVGIYRGDYFFAADLECAQARTESLPWVDRAVVRRLWPNRIVVQLVETTPVALYQTGGALFLADAEGALVAPLTAETASLPEGLRLFTGPDAAVHAASITEKIERFPAIWEQTDALTRQASGRWDLHLAGDLVVRLPLDRPSEGVAKLARLSPAQRASYAVIDLRLSDRITLTPRTAPPTEQS